MNVAFATNGVAAPFSMEPCWVRRVIAARVDANGAVLAGVHWQTPDQSVEERVPMYYMKRTFPASCRNLDCPHWDFWSPPPTTPVGPNDGSDLPDRVEVLPTTL